MYSLAAMIQKRLGIFGFALGCCSGFVSRDEYYHSSYSRLQELEDEFLRKKAVLLADKDLLQEERSRLASEVQSALWQT